MGHAASSASGRKYVVRVTQRSHNARLPLMRLAYEVLEQEGETVTLAPWWWNPYRTYGYDVADFQFEIDLDTCCWDIESIGPYSPQRLNE